MGVEILGYKLIDDDGVFSCKLVREVLAELIGTFYLIILGTGGVLASVKGWDKEGELESMRVLQIAFSFGLGIGGAVHIFSDISGGQYNPAVSFGLFFARKLSLYRAVVLSVVQILAAILGAAIMKAIFGEVPGVVEIAEGTSSFAGLILEILGTLFLVLTVLSTTNSARGHSAGYLQPLSIGIAIFVAHLFLVPYTGCGINPARALGTNIVAGKVKGEIYAYILGPLIAALGGGVIYEFLFNPHYSNKYQSVENGNEMKEGSA